MSKFWQKRGHISVNTFLMYCFGVDFNYFSQAMNFKLTCEIFVAHPSLTSSALRLCTAATCVSANWVT